MMTAMITAAIAFAAAVLTALISGYFAVRIHTLEARVDELERLQESDWHYIRRLTDFIYKAGLNPPERGQ